MLEKRGVKVRGPPVPQPGRARDPAVPRLHRHAGARESGRRDRHDERRASARATRTRVARIGIRVADYLDADAFRGLVRQNLKVRAAEARQGEAAEDDRGGGGSPATRARPPLPWPSYAADTGVVLDGAQPQGARRSCSRGAQGSMLDPRPRPPIRSWTLVEPGRRRGLRRARGVGPDVDHVGDGRHEGLHDDARRPRPVSRRRSRATWRATIREIGKEVRRERRGGPRRIGWLDVPQLKGRPSA